MKREHNKAETLLEVSICSCCHHGNKVFTFNVLSFQISAHLTMLWSCQFSDGNQDIDLSFTDSKCAGSHVQY